MTQWKVERALVLSFKICRNTIDIGIVSLILFKGKEEINFGLNSALALAFNYNLNAITNVFKLRESKRFYFFSMCKHFTTLFKRKFIRKTLFLFWTGRSSQPGSVFCVLFITFCMNEKPPTPLQAHRHCTEKSKQYNRHIWQTAILQLSWGLPAPPCKHSVQ